jgi:hypothetical protein
MKLRQRASAIVVVCLAAYAFVSVQAAIIQGPQEAVDFGNNAGGGSIKIAVAKSQAPEAGTLLMGAGLLVSVSALRRIRPIA